MINRPRLMALALAGAAGALLGRELTNEERAAMKAKRDAQQRETQREREAYWASIENANAARASAAINRHTGKPHENNRAKARRLKKVSA